MITVIVLLIIICSPCLLGAAAGIRFERTLPLVTMGMAAVLFLSGMAGDLRIGFYMILILSVAAMAGSLVHTAHLKRWKSTLSCFFTPSFFCFIAAAVVIAYFFWGKLAYKWDEMNHWMYVVKVMTYLDDFGTSPEAYGVRFASYPPGMAIMQYFACRLDTLLRPGHGFTEWLCYYMYHLFSVSLLVPLFTGFGIKPEWKSAVYIIFMELLSATVFRQEILGILIDPFVGLLTGIAFISVVFTKEKDRLYRAYICLLCATLVLAKDVGLASGLTVALMHIIDTGIAPPKRDKKKLLSAFLPLILMLCAKGLWSLELRTSNAYIQFGNKIDYLNYAKVFFFGSDNAYYRDIADIYKNELFHGSYIEFRGIRVSIFAMYIVLCAAAAVLFAALRLMGENIRKTAALTAVSAVFCGVYIFNIGAVYMYAFEDYDALYLASLWRYVSIALLPLAMICGTLCVFAVERAFEKIAGRMDEYKNTGRKTALRYGLYTAACVVTSVIFVFMSLNSEAIHSLVSRESVSVSREIREQYEGLSDSIKKECAVDDRIYVVAQGRDAASPDGYYGNEIIRLNVYPIYIYEFPHSLGKTENETESSSRYWEDIPYEKWLDDIMENYDYVAVCKTDSQLIEIYGKAFENGDIMPGSLYRVNRKTRRLEPVG